MEAIKKFLDSLKIGLAKLYNSLPSKLKIALMGFSSFVLAGLLSYVARDLANYNASVTNDYIKLLIDGSLPVLAVGINLIQQWGVEKGTKILADKGDEDTISKVQDSIDKKQELIDNRNQ